MGVPFSFLDNALKGRIAETLVEKLFAESGYKVRRSGQEWKAATIESICKKEEGRLPEEERLRPDLVICKFGQNPEYVEVRFARTGNLIVDADFELKCKLYPTMSIVVVNSTHRPFFRVLRYPFSVGGHPLSTWPIMEDKRWKFWPGLYEACEKRVEQFAPSWEPES